MLERRDLSAHPQTLSGVGVSCCGISTKRSSQSVGFRLVRNRRLRKEAFFREKGKDKGVGASPETRRQDVEDRQREFDGAQPREGVKNRVLYQVRPTSPGSIHFFA